MKKFLVVLTVTLIAFTPLIIATHLGFIPNVRYYWSNFYGMDYFEVSSSSGHVNIGKEWISIGTMEYEESSSVTLSSGFWSYSDFLRVRGATSCYVSINVERPVSRFFKIEEGKVMWRDDNFTSDWTLYTNASQGGSADLNNGILDVHASFVSGERNYLLLKNNLLNVNSTEYPYVCIRWKSTDHVARFTVYDSDGNDYKVIVESADGVIHSGTCGGGYSADWIITVYELPPNKTISWMDLGVDSGGGGGGSFPVSGIQHAYFDYVEFTAVSITASNVRITLNDHILFDENLTYPIRSGVYSLDPSKLKYDFIQIPFDANIVQEHNLLSISVGKETNFNVSSPRIYMNTRLEEVKPAWTEIPYHTPLLFVVTAIDIMVGFMIIKRIKQWISQQEQDKT